MNWAGLSVLIGLLALVFTTPFPYGLVFLVPVVIVFWPGRPD